MIIAEPFSIQVPEDVLVDLQHRLKNTRTTHDTNLYFETQFEKDYGQKADFQSQLLEHWTNKYDWRQHESELNKLPHFRTQIDSNTVLHFIHIPNQTNPKAVPLLLVHGWPGSVWEFHHLIPLLKEKFHLVVPSLPGYGWSTTKADEMNVQQIGLLFNKLMCGLGYDQYVTQAGDWGSFVIREMAFSYPQNCVAMHSNMPMFIPHPTRVPLLAPSLALDLLFRQWRLTQFDLQQGGNLVHYVKTGSAYMLTNASKPHTLGYAFSDSPAGLLAYISEKIALWSDPASKLSMDEIITNVMIYWVTNSMTSSMRLYYETIPYGKSFVVPKSKVDKIQVPCGFALMPYEAIAFPLKWLKHTHNAVHATEFKQGGHFAAWEQPEALAEDIHKFVFESIGSFELACKQAKDNDYKPQSGVTMSELAVPIAVCVSAAILGKSML